MTEYTFSDTPVYKLHRTDAPETSIDAAEEVSSGKMLALVYSEVVKAGIGASPQKKYALFIPTSLIAALPLGPLNLNQMVRYII
jgi:hypothetical protein